MESKLNRANVSLETTAEDIFIYDIAELGWRHKFFILCFTIATTIGYFVWNLSVPPRYTSSARLYAVPPIFSTIAAPQDKRGLSSLTGLGLGYGNYIEAWLTSRSVATEVIDRLRLTDRAEFWGGELPPERLRTFDHAFDRFKKVTAVSLEGDEIMLAATTLNSQLSHDIAQEMLEVLFSRLTSDTTSKQVVLGESLRAVRTKLERAEIALGQTMVSTGSPVPLEDALTQTFRFQENVRFELSKAEALLQSTEARLDGPADVEATISLQSVQAGSRARVESLRGALGEAKSELDTFSKEMVEYRKALRELRVLEEIYASLAPLEARAELAEKTKDLPFQVLDPPNIPSRPNRERLLIRCLAIFLLALLVGLVISWASETIVRLQSLHPPASQTKNPDSMESGIE